MGGTDWTPIISKLSACLNLKSYRLKLYPAKIPIIEVKNRHHCRDEVTVDEEAKLLWVGQDFPVGSQRKRSVDQPRWKSENLRVRLK